MSCPSWDRLVAHRYEGPEAREPEGWRAALEHLGSCARCREEAFAADPTLVFTRLPDRAADAAEVNALRTGVQALRRAHRVEERSRSLPVGKAPRAGSRSPIRIASRIAAAVLLAVGLVSFQPGAAGPPLQTADHDAAGNLPDQRPPATLPSPYDDGESVAAVDNFDRPNASVYHFDDEELNVVMVVDPGLDV